MWLVFMASSVIVLMLLYVPGFILLRSISLNPLISICASPAVSIALFSIEELFLNIIGVSSNIFTVGVLTSFVIFLIIVASRSVLAGRGLRSLDMDSMGLQLVDYNRGDILLLTLYLVVGLFAAFYFIVLPLDGPESFFQGWDNLHHLGDTKAFIDSADWSPLFSSRYLSGDIAPYEVSRSFYPSAYHVLCAAVATVIDASVPIVINSLNAILIGVVFATSMFLLMRVLFSNNAAVAFGSILALGTPACPWDYLIYGPLFPNLMSMVFVPICMALFIKLTQFLSSGSVDRVAKIAICFVLSLFAVVCAHPNGVFTLILVLAPYLSFWFWNEMKCRGKTCAILMATQVFYWGIVLLFWCLCREIPLLGGIVNTRWPSIVDTSTAIVNCILLDFFDHPAQPVLAILLIIGAISLIRSGRGNRWLVVSYLLAAFIYVVDASTDGEFKQILAGYWYTDYHRTAPIVALLAIIIAVFGVDAILNSLYRCVNTIVCNSDDFKCRAFQFVPAFLLGSFLFVVTFLDPISQFGIEVRTPFGYQKQEFSKQYNYELIHYDVLTAREQEFCEKAMSVIPDGSLILNSPNDGSVFMYALYGANIYYRGCSVPPADSEAVYSKQIRLHLNDLEYSSDVQQAVRETGAKYLIQLDQGDNPLEFRINFNSYHSEDWIGIESIDDATPGFQIVLSDGDMRLYKINS